MLLNLGTRTISEHTFRGDDQQLTKPKKLTKRQTVLAARTDEAEYLADLVVALGASSLVKEMAAEQSVFLESCTSLAFEFSIHSSNSSFLSSQVLTISAFIISSVAWSAANDHSYRQDVAR